MRQKFFAFLCPVLLFASMSSALPNPATVHCSEQGGTPDIRSIEGYGEYGVCLFTEILNCPDDVCVHYSECEEWAFLRGQCQRGQCGQVVPVNDGNGNWDLQCLP